MNRNCPQETRSTSEDRRIWIAIYTRARHEVNVAKQLSRLGIETFVPLRREIHILSDRRKTVNVPLIPSYIFVQIFLRDYFRIFAAGGVVRPVMFHGRIARIRDEEIKLLRRAVDSGAPVEVTKADYSATDEVEITDGVFAGHHGRVVQFGSKYRIGICIEELAYALVVELPKSKIRLLCHPAKVI